MGGGNQGGPSPLPARDRALRIRAVVLRAIREFFFQNGFVEVETPVRLRAPALETHIDAEQSGGWYLRTSPELHMKRLLGEGFRNIWQMGPCFRRGERGRLHHPEYTMLEWYRAGADYTGIRADTRSLIACVATEVHRACPKAADVATSAASVPAAGTIDCEGRRIDLLAPWRIIAVRDAFLQFAGWDPAQDWDEDRFNVDLVERVEPQLPCDVPVILQDYPAPAAALARRKPDDPAIAERWELYIGGMEIANAYSELTDASEQRARFAACARQRAALGKEVYPLDEEFLRALAVMPPAGGIALGVDRLVMLFAGARHIDDVTAFPE